MLNSGTTKYRNMNQENPSSKLQGEDKTKDLEKRLQNLEKILELQRKTIEHDRQHFGQTYEMT